MMDSLVMIIRSKLEQDMVMIAIRSYKYSDAPAAWALKFDTIHEINIHDYSKAQVDAWAPIDFDMSWWQKRIDQMDPFIADLNGQIVGFADLQPDGYIDHFFCHADYQGCGVGKTLMEHILAVGKAKGLKHYYSHVSITARPFFEHFGFRVIEEQNVNVNGQLLTNFVMEK